MNSMWQRSKLRLTWRQHHSPRQPYLSICHPCTICNRSSKNASDILAKCCRPRNSRTMHGMLKWGISIRGFLSPTKFYFCRFALEYALNWTARLVNSCHLRLLNIKCNIFYNIRTIRTNRMHYLLSIYFNNYPLHVWSRLTAHHQEVLLCIYSNWYMSCVYVDWLLARSILPTASQHKRMTYANCCIYRVVPPDDEQ